MAKKQSKKSTAATATVEPKTETQEVKVPECIAQLKAIAKQLAGLKDIPEKLEPALKKLADGSIKLADRIHNGLGAEAKKAERAAKKKEREEKKAKREANKKAKKQAKIDDLKKKLAELQAEVGEVNTDGDQQSS